MALQCRSCLSTTATEYFHLATYLDWFNQLTQLCAEVDDALPGTFCSSCTASIQSSFEFVQTAQQADALLRGNLVSRCMDTSTEARGIEQELKEDEGCEAEYVVEEFLDDDGNQVRDMELMETENMSENVLETSHESDCCEPKQTFEEELNCSTNTEESRTLGKYTNDDSKQLLYTSEAETDEQYLIEFDPLDEEQGNEPAVNDFKSSSNGPKWKCIVCKRVLRGDVSYEGHMNMHKNLRPYKCTHGSCSGSFRSKFALNHHVVLLHTEQYICQVCDQVLPTQVLLDEHQLAEHQHQTYEVSETGSIECVEDVVSSSEILEINHNHHQQEDYQEQQISIAKRNDWESEFLRKTMISECSSEDGQMTQCTVCKKQLLQRNFKKHMEMHQKKQLPEDNKKYLCSYCPKYFNKKAYMRTHERSAHELKEKEPQHMCTQCNGKFFQLRNLHTHIKRVHTDERKFVCLICGNDFKSRSQLKSHNLLHMARKYKCSQEKCNKTYARQADLDVHMRTHTGELPFECHICEQRFAIKVRLTYHLQQKHDNINYACPYCERVYNHRTKLREHLFQHTGMPYRCELCPNVGYSRRIRFSQHMLRQHNRKLTDDELAAMFTKHTGKTLLFQPADECPEDLIIEEKEEED